MDVGYNAKDGGALPSYNAKTNFYLYIAVRDAESEQHIEDAIAAQAAKKIDDNDDGAEKPKKAPKKAKTARAKKTDDNDDVDGDGAEKPKTAKAAPAKTTDDNDDDDEDDDDGAEKREKKPAKAAPAKKSAKESAVARVQDSMIKRVSGSK